MYTDRPVPPMTYRIRPDVSNDDLNSLFAAAWTHHQPRDFERECSGCMLIMNRISMRFIAAAALNPPLPD